MERKMELNLLNDIWEKRIRNLSFISNISMQVPERLSSQRDEGAAPSETGHKYITNSYYRLANC